MEQKLYLRSSMLLNCVMYSHQEIRSFMCIFLYLEMLHGLIDMKCTVHDLEVMSSNPGWVELKMHIYLYFYLSYT